MTFLSGGEDHPTHNIKIMLDTLLVEFGPDETNYSPTLTHNIGAFY